MGVDWYECKVCGETFPDCGDFVHCNDDCYRRWCSDECAEKDGFVEDREETDEYGDYKKSCNFCRKEDVEDSVLLTYLIGKYFEASREELVKMYFKEIK